MRDYIQIELFREEDSAHICSLHCHEVPRVGEAINRQVYSATLSYTVVAVAHQVGRPSATALIPGNHEVVDEISVYVKAGG